jgi:hypothetical protein
MRVDITGNNDRLPPSESGTRHQTAVKFRVIQVFHSPALPLNSLTGPQPNDEAEDEGCSETTASALDFHTKSVNPNRLWARSHRIATPPLPFHGGTG